MPSAVCSCACWIHLRRPTTHSVDPRVSYNPKNRHWNLAKDVNERIEYCIFREVLKRCPLTRGARFKKFSTWLTIYPACSSLMKLILAYCVNAADPDTLSVHSAFYVWRYQNYGQYLFLFFDCTREEFGVTGRYRGTYSSTAPPNPRFVCRWTPRLQTERSFGVIPIKSKLSIFHEPDVTLKPGIFKNGNHNTFICLQTISTTLYSHSLLRVIHSYKVSVETARSEQFEAVSNPFFLPTLRLTLTRFWVWKWFPMCFKWVSLCFAASKLNHLDHVDKRKSTAASQKPELNGQRAKNNAFPANSVSINRSFQRLCKTSKWVSMLLTFEACIII